MSRPTYMQNRMDELRGWARKELSNQLIMESIWMNPFEGFSERVSKLGDIMKKEGGISPSIRRAIFMGAALNRYTTITMREMEEALSIMERYIPKVDDDDLEKRFRAHALEILMITWDRAEEIGTLVYQLQKKYLDN